MPGLMQAEQRLVYGEQQGRKGLVGKQVDAWPGAVGKEDFLPHCRCHHLVPGDSASACAVSDVQVWYQALLLHWLLYV